MGWIGWIVLGGLAGWIVNMIMHEEHGLLKNIIVGIVGGVVGGGVVELLGGQGVNGFNVYSFVVALIGAVILLWIVKLVRR